MKIINLITAILFTSTILLAANEKAPVVATTSISGQVIDKATGEALAGVKIEIEEKVVYSDLDGNFEISDIVPGKHKINTSLISYKSAIVDIDCEAKAKELEIKLDNK
jgi:carboxypeptidase-like protein